MEFRCLLQYRQKFLKNVPHSMGAGFSDSPEKIFGMALIIQVVLSTLESLILAHFT